MIGLELDEVVMTIGTQGPEHADWAAGYADALVSLMNDTGALEEIARSRGWLDR